MRYQYLDILRWICIVLMVLFHLNYSLVNIFDIHFLNFSETFWYVVWRVSALWFMMISWASFYLASKKYSAAQLQNKYISYGWVLAIIALGITLGTYFFMPDQLILFGILHFFAVSFFLLPFISRVRYWAILALFAIAIITQLWDTQVSNAFMFPLWFYNSDFRSADYYPLIPYFWYILWWYLIAGIGDRYNLLRVLQIERALNTQEIVLTYL